MRDGVIAEVAKQAPYIGSLAIPRRPSTTALAEVLNEGALRWELLQARRRWLIPGAHRG